MQEDLNEMTQNLKLLKDLQENMNDFDMTNPESILESLGITEDELSKMFLESMDNHKIDLGFINKSDSDNPKYEHLSDSGFDLRASEEIWIQANDRKLISTGLVLDIPDGHEIQIRSKSGLALNQGLMVLNSPGTVDSGYLGEIKVILFNTTSERIKISKGQKIAQAVLCPVISGKWINFVELSEIGTKDRNDNGFGSTGL
jgi:dUTP pyrophosphatase